MADDANNKLKSWTQGARKKATDVATGAADAISDKYKESGLQDKISDLVSGTKEQLDRSGIATATKKVAEKGTDVLDTVSGQKILDRMEERIALQDKYNDILATKLDEALRRIEALEKLFAKVPSR